MSHEIEAEYIEDYWNEAKQCKDCTSFLEKNGVCHCSEGKCEVSRIGYCNFFQSKD